LADLVTAGLDFYGDTMTLTSTNSGFPVTYVINPDMTEAALQASFAADLQDAEVDALWLARVPIGPRNPDIGQVPSLPMDLQPGHVFDAPTVFTEYRHYQRLIPSFVNFGGNSVPVVNVQDWHFLRNGRVMMRFVQHRSVPGYPVIVPEVITLWAAYAIEPRPETPDIFHRYADHSLRIETDLAEKLEMTLEDGRRHLFWGRNRAVLDEWAAEQSPIPCQAPANFDPSLMNTGLSLRTAVPPDDIAEGAPVHFSLRRAVTGNLAVQGTSQAAATLVTERATSLTSPVVWLALQTNAVPAGPFAFALPASRNVQSFYRLRQQ
jgi:hypothetical protein